MKVLFLSSGNSKTFQISPIIRMQQASLEAKGVEVSNFLINGKGVGGYYRAAAQLRAWLRDHPVDLIHAHYTLSGWVGVLSGGRPPLVLSLMGSDTLGQTIGPGKVALRSRYLTLLTLLIQPFVDAIISKSANIERYVFRKKRSFIIPNGVLLDRFRPLEGDLRKELGLEQDKRYVLFLANPADPLKNFDLVREAIRYIDRPDVELINPYPVPPAAVPKFLNAVDVNCLCSFNEGSPNIVKESMACNCPLVVTDVGDAAWVVGDTPGCYVASFDPEDYARKVLLALEFADTRGRTKGRERIIELGLQSETVADRVVDVYKMVLKNHNRS